MDHLPEQRPDAQLALVCSEQRPKISDLFVFVLSSCDGLITVTYPRSHILDPRVPLRGTRKPIAPGQQSRTHHFGHSNLPSPTR